MTNAELEVIRIGGDKLMNVVRKEFTDEFFFVARNVEIIVLSDGKKNVSFSRAKNRVLERNTFEGGSKFERKK